MNDANRRGIKETRSPKSSGRSAPRRLSNDELTAASGGSVKGAVSAGLLALESVVGDVAGAVTTVTGSLLPSASHWNGGKGPRG